MVELSHTNLYLGFNRRNLVELVYISDVIVIITYIRY